MGRSSQSQTLADGDDPNLSGVDSILPLAPTPVPKTDSVPDIRSKAEWDMEWETLMNRFKDEDDEWCGGDKVTQEVDDDASSDWG